jgi:hypothetical protein
MNNQLEAARKKSKIEDQIENYPTLGLVRYEWRWRKEKSQKWQHPKMKVNIQIADPASMHLQANNIKYEDRCYVMGDNNLRGTREEYMCAVNDLDRIIATLYWKRGDHNKMSKDIFKMVSPEQVAYLMWIQAIEWYEPASEKREEETDGILFAPGKKGVEVNVCIFRRPKDKTFQELIKIAHREKKEREGMYLLFPKEQPDFPGIHEALKKGLKMHAFSSGGGLRVVSFPKGGYGEHPHIEEALKHLEEDCLAGGRPYKEVYGKLCTHYLTGDTLSTSNLDYWIRSGKTFDCWQKGDEVIFQLKGLTHVDTPREIFKKVMQTGISEKWQHRGYTYLTTKSTFPSGEPCASTKIIEKPKDSKDNADPWMYRITKTGRGKNFWDAVKKAFKAPEVEVIEKK